MTAILETPTPAAGLPIAYSCGCSYVTPLEELCALCAADVLKVQRETMRGVCECGMLTEYRGGVCNDCVAEAHREAGEQSRRRSSRAQLVEMARSVR